MGGRASGHLFWQQKSDEVIKSSCHMVLSRSQVRVQWVFPDSVGCASLCNYTTHLEAFNEHSETYHRFPQCSYSSVDDSYENSDYVDAFSSRYRSDFYHEEFADELAHILSSSEYDHFCFKIEPELGNLTIDVVEDIFLTREPRVHVPNDCPDSEASRARGFCPSITRASNPQLHFRKSDILILSTNVYL
ncbi:hypothetical protein Tco_0090593 [Tanacetum coccineum]